MTSRWGTLSVFSVSILVLIFAPIFALAQSGSLSEYLKQRQSEKDSIEANAACSVYVYWKATEACKSTKDKNGVSHSPNGYGCTCTVNATDGDTTVKVVGHCEYDQNLKHGDCKATNMQIAGNKNAPVTNDAGAGANLGTVSNGGNSTAGSGAGGGSASGGAGGGSLGGVPGSATINQAYNSPPSTPPSSPSPSNGNTSISGINSLAGGSTNIQAAPASTSFIPPSTAGLNWSYLGQYAQTLGGQAQRGQAQQTTPQQPNIVYYYPGYEIASRQNTSGFVSPTITQSGQSFYGPIKDYSSFIEIMSHAGGSVLSGIENMYNSFAGITKPDIAPIPEIGTRSTVTIAGTEEDLIANPSTSTEVDASQSLSNQPLLPQVEAGFAIQRIQDSLRLLDATLAARSKPSVEATSTAEIHASAKASSFDHTSSTQQTSQEQTAAEKVPEKISNALKTAEERVAKLQNELEHGKSQLKNSSDKIRQLTDELNAMNQRIQAVNQALADPSISENDHESLMSALLANIELTLNDAEKKLEQAVAEEKPRTVGEVVIEALNGGLSGFVQWTMQISGAITLLVQSFWRSIFTS